MAQKADFTPEEDGLDDTQRRDLRRISEAKHVKRGHASDARWFSDVSAQSLGSNSNNAGQ